MKILIVYAHPNPSSFNAAIKENLENELKMKGDEVKVRDLYNLCFNSVLSANDFSGMHKGEIPQDILTEQEFINWADTIIFVYPTWWSSIPAILKGYIDRVFLNGFAYKYGAQGPEGLLTNKNVIIMQTTGSSEEVLNKNNIIQSMNNCIDNGIFGFCGMKVILHKYFYAVPTITDDERKGMLEDVKNIIKNI